MVTPDPRPLTAVQQPCHTPKLDPLPQALRDSCTFSPFQANLHQRLPHPPSQSSWFREGRHEREQNTWNSQHLIHATCSHLFLSTLPVFSWSVRTLPDPPCGYTASRAKPSLSPAQGLPALGSLLSIFLLWITPTDACTTVISPNLKGNTATLTPHLYPLQPHVFHQARCTL